MTTETFTCKECGTVVTYEYDGCGSYSQMFSEREWVEVHCTNRDCNAVVATVAEY